MVLHDLQFKWKQREIATPVSLIKPEITKFWKHIIARATWINSFGSERFNKYEKVLYDWKPILESTRGKTSLWHEAKSFQCRKHLQGFQWPGQCCCKWCKGHCRCPVPRRCHICHHKKLVLFALSTQLNLPFMQKYHKKKWWIKAFPHHFNKNIAKSSQAAFKKELCV